MLKPDANLSMSVNFSWKKKLWKVRGKSGLGHRAAGPPIVGRKPLGFWAFGLSWAMGCGRRWAAGRWVAGLQTPFAWFQLQSVKQFITSSKI